MIPALVRHVVESTVFAGVVAIFPFLMRKRGAAARHAVWLLAASKFALPVALFSAAGMELRSFLPVHRALFAGSIMMPGFLLPAGEAPIASGTASWIPILLLAVWLGGAALMLAVWLRGFFASQVPSAAVLDGEIDALARMQRQMGLRRRVELRSLRSQAEPGIRGIRRLTITFPEGLSSSLTPREFEAILLHELAHAKRRDNLTLGFVHFLVCLFWFDPLLWWIERRLIAEQELACDELALRCGSTGEEYASGILKVCRFHLTGAVAGACGITGSSLKSRLEAIMSFRPNQLNHRSPRFLVGALVMAMTIVPLAIGFFATSRAFGQAAKASHLIGASTEYNSAVICPYAGVPYPLGSVIQQVNPQGHPVLGEQICVAAPRGGPAFWAPTNRGARRRSQHVITIPPPLPRPPCKPVASPSPRYCACGTGTDLFSWGAIIHPAPGKGWLRCDKGKWRPFIWPR